MSICETTIRRGLPVAIAYAIFPPEPDVGIFTPIVEISEVRVWDKRKNTFRRAAWLEKALTQEEWRELEAAAIEFDAEDNREWEREYD